MGVHGFPSLVRWFASLEDEARVVRVGITVASFLGLQHSLGYLFVRFRCTVRETFDQPLPVVASFMSDRRIGGKCGTNRWTAYNMFVSHFCSLGGGVHFIH